MTSGWTHREAEVNGLRLHWVEAGEGPLVVLLHGFPEHWRAWRRQIGPLADAGFRVAAPDLRGYGRSDKPRGIDAYRIRPLVEDVEGLIRVLGAERAHVAGHDWGGVVAWYAAMLRPERIARLAIVNAPHPAAFRRALLRTDQALRSWYAVFFQLPLLPEAAFRRDGFALVARALRGSARAGAFTDEDLAAYRAAAARPGAMTAMLNYYRAAARRRTPRPRPIPHETLLIWGERDRALHPSLADGLEPWVPRIRVERLPGATHWVMAEAPARVSALLADFFRGA